MGRDSPLLAYPKNSAAPGRDRERSAILGGFMRGHYSENVKKI
jgi:hypothetical protein